jgi:glycosyltransferase involved in cell wall biosynthesis
MRVALIHDWLTGMRGGEKCLEVFCELFPEADLYTLIYAPDEVSRIIRQMKVHPSWLNRLPWIRRTYRYYLPLFPRVAESFDLRGYDLVVSSSHCVAKGVHAQHALHIAYIYSPMRYVWDLHGVYFGTDSSLSSRYGMAAFREYLQRWDIRSSQRVDYFVAISRNIAAKVEKFYGRQAAVIYPPVDIDRFFIQERPGSYYLVVSALVPYKRIDLAIRAFNALNLPLKIAGDGPLRKALEKTAATNIEFLGWVDDVRLAELYAGCQALIFPGEEDFGIVPLEAQASGRPVIGYGKGGLLETVIGLTGPSPQGCPTGIFFPEQHEQSLIGAVELYHRCQREFHPDHIRQHAAKFSRERFKQEMAEYLETCVTQGHQRPVKNHA